MFSLVIGTLIANVLGDLIMMYIVHLKNNISERIMMCLVCSIVKN
ncbi:hypothetical protein ACXXHG_11360 [Staphylococcus epidermidis]